MSAGKVDVLAVMGEAALRSAPEGRNESSVAKPDPLEAVELLECCGEPAEGGICWCQYRKEAAGEGWER